MKRNELAITIIVTTAVTAVGYGIKRGIDFVMDKVEDAKDSVSNVKGGWFE